jgi:hypothetical protein
VGGALLLAAGVAGLGFNGLYGQDAHEYLHLSRAYTGLLHGQPYIPSNQGDAEFAVGYPLLGAALKSLIGNDVLSLQLISLASYGIVLYLFNLLLRLLTPGAMGKSRNGYVWVALALSPYLIRAGITVMSDAMGLALLLASLLFGFLHLEFSRTRDGMLAAFFMAACFITRFSTAPFLMPLALAIGWNMFHKKNWAAIFGSALAACLMLLPHFWLKEGVSHGLMGHSLLHDWSLLNAFQRNFTTVSGTIHYPFPNAVFASVYPLVSPGFVPLLPLLFFLYFRTDLLLPAKRLLLVCLVAETLFLMGLPSQNARYLMPGFVTVLLLLFPAWDRFFAYGFYFLKHQWMRLILGAVVIAQVITMYYVLAPTVRRNRLEQTVVASLKQNMPPEADLYAFDLDVAIKNYLPDLKLHNLWEKRYDRFPVGSFVLFNEPKLRQQWAGQNPMLNWDDLKANSQIRAVENLDDGWTLYRVEASNK